MSGLPNLPYLDFTLPDGTIVRDVPRAMIDHVQQQAAEIDRLRADIGAYKRAMWDTEQRRRARQRR